MDLEMEWFDLYPQLLPSLFSGGLQLLSELIQPASEFDLVEMKLVELLDRWSSLSRQLVLWVVSLLPTTSLLVGKRERGLFNTWLTLKSNGWLRIRAMMLDAICQSSPSRCRRPTPSLVTPAANKVNSRPVWTPFCHNGDKKETLLCPSKDERNDAHSRPSKPPVSCLIKQYVWTTQEREMTLKDGYRRTIYEFATLSLIRPTRLNRIKMTGSQSLSLSRQLQYILSQSQHTVTYQK